MEFSNSQCRVCLADGDIPIFDEEELSIAEDIIIFGDIQIDKGDELPKHICDSCFQMLMGAIVFRNAAKQSDEVLRNSFYSINSYKNESVDSDFPSNISESSDDTRTGLQTQDDDMVSLKSGTVYSDCVSNLESNEINDDQTVIVYVDNQSDTENMSITEYDRAQCDLCNMEFESIEDYNRHIYSDNHILLIKEQSNTHKVVHNTDEAELLKMLECTTCKLQFHTMEDFEEHCRSEMHQNSFRKASKSQEKVKCTVCEKYVTKYYFQLHVKLHGNEEQKEKLLQQCPYCEKSLHYTYFRAHIRRKHKDKVADDGLEIKWKRVKREPTQYICDKCGKVFKKQYNLNVHLLTHGAELTYKCMFCPYRGLHPGLLKIHVRTHTKDYNYKCTECPAKFLTKSNLTKHLRRHTGLGDFQCESCEKRFYSITELRQHHEAVHLGIKRHICNICGKAFSCRNYMMCHQLKFHKRKRLKEGKGRLPNYLLNEVKKNNGNEDKKITTTV